MEVDDRQIIRTVREMTRGLRGTVRGMVRRATIGTLNVASKLQTLQAKTLHDDVDDHVELFEPYGFTSAPPAGSEGLIFRVGGERAHSIAALFGKRSTRPTDLERGEVAMYHESGSRIVMRNDGNIEVFPATGGVVKLGGDGAGAQPVARAGDPVEAVSTFATWAAAVESGIAKGAFAGTPFATVFEAAPFATIRSGGEGSTST